MAKEILIYAQANRSGKVIDVVLELANAAHDLSEKLENACISALLITDGRNLDENKHVLKKAGFNKVYIASSEYLKDYSTEYYSQIAIDLIKKIEPEIFLIGATTQGRDLAPVISTKLKTGLTADCTSLDINEKGQLAATRPTFGGNLMATILCKQFPQMATVRPKVLKKSDKNYEQEPLIIEYSPDLSNINKRVELLDFIANPQLTVKRIDEAEIIVSGGKGMKKNLQMFWAVLLVLHVVQLIWDLQTVLFKLDRQEKLLYLKYT